MSPKFTIRDPHLGENILGECPHCRLPIYQSDPRRMLSCPPGSPPELHHAGCSMSREGDFYERQLAGDVDRLRGCGYVIELTLVRPVR